MELHQWLFGTKMFRAMIGEGGGSEGIDEDFATRSMTGFGAFILGRNMFGPVRGDWPDESWKGWWGDDPPYHAPTFILTHYPRAPIVMEGGHDFSLRHERNCFRVKGSKVRGRRKRRQDRRRHLHGAAISYGWTDRRDALGNRAGRAGRW